MSGCSVNGSTSDFQSEGASSNLVTRSGLLGIGKYSKGGYKCHIKEMLGSLSGTSARLQMNVVLNVFMQSHIWWFRIPKRKRVQATVSIQIGPHTV